MKIFALVTILLISTNLFAGSIRPGDIVLISINCRLCQAIETETNSNFSHSGLVISANGSEVKLVESIGQVTTLSIKEFTKRARSGSKIAVMRNHELDYIYSKNKYEFNELISKMIFHLNDQFMDLPFDHDFLWDNFDKNGNELLYCSEMITKLLNTVLTQKIEPEAMSFKKLPDFWNTYFKGNVPEGLPGNSPESFYKSDLFFIIM